MTVFLKENKNLILCSLEMELYGYRMAWGWVNFTYGWTIPQKFSKIIHNRGATSLSKTRACHKIMFFHDECMSLVILLSVLRLVKVSWWQLACCVVTAFSSITSSPSTLITILPWFLGQMPCLLEVARCTLCVIFPLLFSLFYASSFLT